MTRRILTRETFDHQPGVGEVQGHDPRLRFAAIFNTLSPIVGVSSAKPLVLGGGSVLQPGHYGMGVFNPSNANIGAASSSSDVRFNSTLSDLAVVLAVNWLHGGYTERSVTLLNLSGGYYVPSITMNSYYSPIDGRFAEGYSGTTLSGSFAKSVPGVVVFRRIGTALTLECRSATGAYGRYTTTDTKRSVPELGAGGVSIGGGNAVAAAYIIEGTVDDDEARALLSNPWRVFKGRRLFVGGWAAGGGGSSSDLTIQDASHAHTSDSPVLVAQSTLAIADASHAHAADSLTLTTLSVLSIADATHGHAADNLTLAGSSAADLVIQDASHAHTSDSPVLVAQSTLAIADSSHAHAADSLTLTTLSVLSIADSSHAHAADNLTLSTGLVVDLTIQEASHGHAADNVALAVQSFLQILDASHGHTADSLTLTTMSVLVIADAVHGHSADNLTLGVPVGLAIVDATHGHTADNLTLSITALTLVASPDYIGRHTARNFSTARHRTRNFSTAT
jgi:hypothetical protein